MGTETDNRLWPGWKTICQIGKGSYGRVYEIQRDTYGYIDKAALKVISIPEDDSEIKELLDGGSDLESVKKHYISYRDDILNEYKLMARLKGNSNVVSCEDIQVKEHEDGVGWDILIRMELLTPLTQTLSKDITESEVIKLGKDLTKAFSLCAHEGIIHRDIKPQNIFRSVNGDYKLGDFGIAKVADRTASGTIIGTYRYMAPEVFQGKPYGASADMYSLGLVLYWLLNNFRTPFLTQPPQIPSVQEEEEARKKRFEGETLPRPVNGDSPIVDVVLKACSFDPSYRYKNPEEMLAALEAIKIQDKYYKPFPPPLTETVYPMDEKEMEQEGNIIPVEQEKRKRNRKIWYFGLMAAIVLVLIAFRPWNLLSNHDEDVEPSETVRPTATSTPVPTSTPEETTSIEEDEQILPMSSERLLTDEDISGLDTYQIQMAINEIYARYGYVFQDPSMAAYFEEQSWYVPADNGKSISYSDLTSIETQNIEFLRKAIG